MRECWAGLGSILPRAAGAGAVVLGGGGALGGSPPLWYAASVATAAAAPVPPTRAASAAPSAAASAAPSAGSGSSSGDNVPFARNGGVDNYISDSIPSCASTSSIARYTAGLPLSIPPVTRSSSDGALVPGPNQLADTAPRAQPGFTFKPVSPSPLPSPVRTPMPPRWAHLSAAVALSAAAGPRARLTWPDIARLTRGVGGLTVRLFWDDEPASGACGACGFGATAAGAATSPRAQDGSHHCGGSCAARNAVAPALSPRSLYPASTPLYAPLALSHRSLAALGSPPTPAASGPPSQRSSCSTSPLIGALHAHSPNLTPPQPSPHLPTRPPSALLPLHRQHSCSSSSPKTSPQLGTIHEMRCSGARGAESDEDGEECGADVPAPQHDKSGLDGLAGERAAVCLHAPTVSPWQKAAAIVMDGSVSFCALPQPAPAAALQVHLDCGAKRAAAGWRRGGGGAGGGNGGDTGGRTVPSAPPSVLLPPSLAHATRADGAPPAPIDTSSPFNPALVPPRGTPAHEGGPVVLPAHAAMESTVRAAVARATRAAADAAVVRHGARDAAPSGSVPAQAPGSAPAGSLGAPSPAPPVSGPAVTTAAAPTPAAHAPALPPAVAPAVASPRALAQVDSSLRIAARLEAKGEPAAAAEAIAGALEAFTAAVVKTEAFTAAGVKTEAFNEAGVKALGACEAVAGGIASPPVRFGGWGLPSSLWGTTARTPTAEQPRLAPPVAMGSAGAVPPARRALLSDAHIGKRRTGAAAGWSADGSHLAGGDLHLAGEDLHLAGGDVGGAAPSAVHGCTSWLHPAGWRCLAPLFARLQLNGHMRFPPPPPVSLRSTGRKDTADNLREAARLFGGLDAGARPTNPERSRQGPRHRGVRVHAGEQSPGAMDAIAW